jgi:hypothetical protein
MTDSFKEVFSALRAILERHISKLVVTENSPTRYCLEGGLHPKHKKPMQIAWVEIGKSYVSFHHMGTTGIAPCPNQHDGTSNTWVGLYWSQPPQSAIDLLQPTRGCERQSLRYGNR